MLAVCSGEAIGVWGGDRREGEGVGVCEFGAFVG